MSVSNYLELMHLVCGGQKRNNVAKRKRLEWEVTVGSSKEYYMAAQLVGKVNQIFLCDWIPEQEGRAI